MKTCGNHKVKCYYRENKFCKRPREFKCKDILNKIEEKKINEN